MRRSSELVDLASGSDHPRIFFTCSEEPQNRIVHGSTKYRSVTLDMETPPTILLVLPGKDVSSNLGGMCRWDGRVGHVPGNHQSR